MMSFPEWQEIVRDWMATMGQFKNGIERGEARRTRGNWVCMFEFALKNGGDSWGMDRIIKFLYIK